MQCAVLDFFVRAWAKAPEAIWGLLTTVIGVLVGGFLVNRFFVRKANLAGLVERVCNCLDTLRADCAEYWTADFSASDCAKNTILEAKIKSQVLQVNAISLLIFQKYSKAQREDRETMFDLFTACTGGDFETSTRKANKRQYMKIVGVINRLAVRLHQLKL